MHNNNNYILALEIQLTKELTHTGGSAITES